MQPLIQNELEATFCSILSKEDKWIDYSILTAKEIYNFFRAYSRFPGVWIKNEFFGNIKLNKIKLNTQFNTFSDIQVLDKTPGFILVSDSNSKEWLQININKNLQTYLICRNNTLLQVEEIILDSGKKVNFTGYNFLNKVTESV